MDMESPEQRRNPVRSLHRIWEEILTVTLVAACLGSIALAAHTDSWWISMPTLFTAFPLFLHKGTPFIRTIMKRRRREDGTADWK